MKDNKKGFWKATGSRRKAKGHASHCSTGRQPTGKGQGKSWRRCYMGWDYAGRGLGVGGWVCVLGGCLPHFSLILLSLTGGNKARLFLRGTLDRQGATDKLQILTQDKETCSPRGRPSTATSCLGMMLNLHPWRYPKRDWTQPGAT